MIAAALVACCLVSAVAALTMSDAQKFCQARQSIEPFALVDCSGDGVVFCRGREAVSFQDCEGKACHPHLYVPATCGTESKIFTFTNAEGQRANKWRWWPKGITENLDRSQFAAAVANWSDTSLYIESTSIHEDDNTDDMFMFDISPVPSLPLGAVIHGIKVGLMMRSHQHEIDLISSKEIVGNTFCYVKDLELRTGSHVSGNRGAGDVSKKRMIGKDFGKTPIVFGGRLDTWDEFSDINNFGHDTKLEIDFKAGVFNNSVYMHNGASNNDVSCFVAKGQMEVFYSVPPKTSAVPVYLVMSGFDESGTEWSFYNATIADVDPPLPSTPPSDKNGKIWTDPDYVMDKDWSRGKGPFGYDEDGEANHGIEHTHFTHHRFTSYFRTEFDFNYETTCAGDMFIKMLVDDGAIVYLNGLPLYWINMDPEFDNLPTYFTRAIRDVFHEEQTKLAVVPDHTLLVRGKNSLAIEVHQVHPDSSDMLFDMSLWIYTSCNVTTTDPPTPAPTDAPTKSTVAPTAKKDTDVNDDDDSSPAGAKSSSSGWTAMLLAGVGVGLFIVVAFFVWQRFNQKRASRRGVSYANFVDESNAAPPTTPSVPLQFGTEPELSRPSYGASGAAAATSPTTATASTFNAKRVVRSTENWDNF